MSFLPNVGIPALDMFDSEEERGMKELFSVIKELGKPISQGSKTNSCDEVHPSIFVGDRAAATNFKLLRDLEITHVVNTAEGSGNQGIFVHTGAAYYKEQGLPLSYLGVAVQDQPKENISRYFHQVADFIESAVRQGGKVLVHCMMGISRSATCVIAYLMIKCDMAAAEALRLLLKRRPTIRPNDGFLRQLVLLQRTLRRDRLFECSGLRGSYDGNTTSTSTRVTKDQKMYNQDSRHLPEFSGRFNPRSQEDKHLGCNSNIASGPFASCPDNDYVIPYPRPPPSVELRSGVLISGCQCVKRDGLQHDCPRTGCQGRAHCMAFPAPVCVPSGNAPPDYLQETSSTASSRSRSRASGETVRRPQTRAERGEHTPHRHQQEADYVKLAHRGYVENPAVKIPHQKRVPCREHRKIRA